MDFQLKPNKTAFLFRGLFTGILSLAVVLGGGAVVSLFIMPLVSLILLVLLVVLVSVFYYLRLIEYNKLNYQFFDNRIVQKKGTIFSDVEVELMIKNITHVSHKLPFIENKLFGTGHLDIESAGSGGTEIHLCSIDKSHDMYNQVVELMHNNGFNLSQDEVMQSERPHPLGVFFEVFKNFFVSVLVIFYVVAGIFEDNYDNFEAIVENNFAAVIALGLLVVFLLLIKQAFLFVDLMRRRYKIYRNIITYSEGFLSKNFSFIPFENLTDSATTQTFVDKLFGLNDVKISCQGSSHEILFKNLKNGVAMSDTLDKLLAEHKHKTSLPRDSEGETMTLENASESISNSRTKKTNLNLDNTFTATYKIDFVREFFAPIVFFILFFIVCLLIVMVTDMTLMGPFALIHAIVVILVSVIIYLKVYATKFIVKEHGVKYSYNFLTTKNIEFSADKVTGVLIKRSFIDKWFGTMSLNFMSIGASSVITFRHIKKTENLISDILSKFGLHEEMELYHVRAKYNLFDNLKNAIFELLAFVFFAFIFIVVILISSQAIGWKASSFTILAFVLFVTMSFVVMYLYRVEYYKRTKVVFLKNFVYASIGWLFKSYYYAKYNDIKDITTTRYPFSREGKISFNIAGEVVSTQQSGKFNLNEGASIRSNSFSINYVDYITVKDELIDHIFKFRPDVSALREYLSKGERIETDKNIRLVAKPMLANTLALAGLPMLIGSVFFLLMFFGLSEVLPFFFGLLFVLLLDTLIIGMIIWSVKVKTYYIEDYRVIAKSGIFYKQQKSIIFDKIDFINNSQFFLNKVFHNGNVTVNTVGSSRPEMTLKNMKNYREFYEMLKGIYEQG